MNKIPFEYGSIAENEYFIDRIEDRRDLKTFLGGGINVMLISPRRWGKSSLVKAAMEELKQEQKDVRVCYLDAFKIFSEEEFYNKFASAVLQGVSSTMEKRWADIVKFIQTISPSLTISSDPVNAVEVNLSFKPLKESAEEILNLPEKIAKAKGIHVIVCIDEFQQLANLPDWKRLEGTMRSIWQGQHSTTYCLYGSKRHMMMDIFGNSKNPFYRFGQMMTLKKIAKEYWKPFIHDSFYNYGKSISDDIIEKICNTVQCHSWYMQQFCFLIWTRTATKVTEEEHRIIEQRMKLVPTRNMAAYMRKLALDGYIIQIDHTDIKKMTAEIQKIGVNVNQIAKRVNSTGSVYQEDINEIREALAEIWRLQRLNLLKAH